MVPKSLPIQLNASFKFIIPQLYSKYPNMVMLTTKPPQVMVAPTRVPISQLLHGEVNVQVVYPNKAVQSPFVFCLTMYMNVFLWVQPNGTRQVISVNVSLLKFTFVVTSSNIGTILIDLLNKAVGFLVNLFVIPLCN